MAEGSTSRGRALVCDPDATSRLTDDLLVEILSRVPYKSSFCCKCVSTRWRGLITHPDNRKKMPQSLVGFFNETFVPDRSPQWARCYTDLSDGVYPPFDRPLSFLMPECEMLEMYDSCNGLLLVRGWNHPYPKTLGYVVCNPVTEKWVSVPASIWSSQVRIAHLGFDPAVSSHFHVFEFVPAFVWDAEPEIGRINSGAKALGIYSSESGVWTHRCVWNSPVTLPSLSRSAFLDGVLYLSSSQDFVIAVDVKGNSKPIRIPSSCSAGDKHNVHLSQGKLHLAYKRASALSIWVLEDSGGDNWTLKHNISRLQLFGEDHLAFAWKYDVISIHSEHNMIVVICCSGNARLPKTVMSYDMDSAERRFICHQLSDIATPRLPLVPLFSELLANGH